MTTITLTSEDYAALVAERDGLRDACDGLNGEVRTLKVKVSLLEERLKAHLRTLFDAKSEVRGTEQKDMFFNEAEALAPTGTSVAEEAAPDIEIPAHTRKKRGRKPLDPNLPRDIVRHELPESERICAHDGAALVEIGVEISEQLDIVPQQVRVIQHQRVKYACPCCDESIKVTPAPARIIPKGLLTASALAWVVTSKYMDALPLYRQAALLGRFGGDLSRATLAASIVKVGDAVQPIINLLRDHLLEADLIHADETTLQVLKEPGRAAQTKSYLWAQASGTGPPIRLFGYAPGRGAKQAETLFAGIKPGGVLMSDGYEVYGGIAQVHGLTHLGCWAHYLASRFILGRWPETPDVGAIAMFARVSSAKQTRHKICCQVESERRVGGWRCRFPCGRSRVSRHTSRAVSGAMPVCLHVPCIRPAAVH